MASKQPFYLYDKSSRDNVMNAFTCLSSQVHIVLPRPDIVVERIISLCQAKTRNNDWIYQLPLLFVLVETVRQLYSHCTTKVAEHHPAHRKNKKTMLSDNLLYREQRANQDASF